MVGGRGLLRDDVAYELQRRVAGGRGTEDSVEEATAEIARLGSAPDVSL